MTRKYLRGSWEDREGDGLGGFADPIIRANRSWHDPEGKTDAPWGPSVHYNTYLRRYVMLMNRALDNSPNWRPGGIYVSYSSDPSRPELWTRPYPIVGLTQWYPQVVGLPRDRGTDKEAGRWATFKVGQWILHTPHLTHLTISSSIWFINSYIVIPLISVFSFEFSVSSFDASG